MGSLPLTRIKKFVSSASRLDKALFILTVFYAGFAITGQSLFFTEYPVPHVFRRTLIFIFFCGCLFIPALAFLYFTHLAKTWVAKNSLPATAAPASSRKLFLIFFSFMGGCWLLYLIGFFPATISPDSLEAWKQAIGVKPFYDEHPILYSLIIKVLIKIWYSPAVVALFQILAMAGVCSSFLVFLYKAGIPYKWLLILAILTAIMPANGIMTIVLWKDILYSCCLVWLTLIMAELVTGNYLFNQKTTLVCLALSLLGVALLRHNGVFAAFLVALILVIWAIKSKRKGIILSVSFFLLVFIAYKNVVLPYWLKAKPVPSGFTKAPPIHGIAAVIYYNGELSPETRQEMEKLLPMEEWKSHYNPFSADEIMFQTKPGFLDSLSEVPTSTVMKMYTNTFMKNPFLVVKDRLSGCELLWNVNQADGASNYSYEPNIEENEFGFKHHENGLHKVLMGLLKFTGKALDPISRRCGIFHIVLILIFVYMVSQSRRNWLIFLPLIGANLSLLLSMTYQSFRYVYYIPLLVGVMWLLAISNIDSGAKTEKV